MDQESPLRDPKRLFFQADSIRRWIIASYWIVILLAVPLWWHTTSIERHSLPKSRVLSLERHSLSFPIDLYLDAEESSVRNLEKILSNVASKDSNIRLSLHRGRGPPNASSYMIIPSQEQKIGHRELYFSITTHSMPDLANVLSTLLEPPSSLLHQQQRAAVYAPRYRLAFSLLNEDSSAGDVISEWDASRAISKQINPLLRSLSTLHNFTIESQIQFHAPLAFKPQTLDDGLYALTPEDLTVFVNSAEWTLSSSVSNDPVLHFVVFVPSAARRPLHILESQGSISPSHAFLLPQWGGIVIHNPSITPSSKVLSSLDSDSVFASFASQLQILLGVPSIPSELERESSAALTGWQIDALMRRRATENARESRDTLTSIINLVDKIESMPVGEDVLGDVQDALSALEKMYATSVSSLTQTLQSSAKALTLSSRAFFSPGMLALLYFPAEHKYAVYTPLFASAVIPLFAAAMREISAWRRERRAQQANQ